VQKFSSSPFVDFVISAHSPGSSPERAGLPNSYKGRACAKSSLSFCPKGKGQILLDKIGKYVILPIEFVKLFIIRHILILEGIRKCHGKFKPD
jgi:hypothetical protein